MNRSDLVGLEFDWFAMDADGCVALLSSAGWGPVPDAVFDRFEEQAQIGQHLTTLCGIRESDDLDCSSQALLQRGIFAYDWDGTFGPYVRFGVPAIPTDFAALGFASELRQAFITFPNHHFRLSSELHESDIPSFTDVSR